MKDLSHLPSRIYSHKHPLDVLETLLLCDVLTVNVPRIIQMLVLVDTRITWQSLQFIRQS